MQMRTDSMAYQISDNTKAEAFSIFLNGYRDVIEMIASFGKFNPLKKALSGNFNQFFRIIVDLTDAISPGCIRVISFIDNTCIQTDNITLIKEMFLMRNSMDNLIIDRDTDGGRLAIVIFE